MVLPEVAELPAEPEVLGEEGEPLLLSDEEVPLETSVVDQLCRSPADEAEADVALLDDVLACAAVPEHPIAHPLKGSPVATSTVRHHSVHGMRAAEVVRTITFGASHPRTYAARGFADSTRSPYRPGAGVGSVSADPRSGRVPVISVAASLMGLALLGEPPFAVVDSDDGILLEARPVAGSKFSELRASARSPRAAAALCQAAFDDSRAPSTSTEVKLRRVLLEKVDERVTYDQISAPLVSDRDYAFRIRRQAAADGSCRVVFEAANELAPPVQPGWVRIEELRGSWTFTPESGGARVVYVIHTDPGGSLPAFVVEGGSRKAARRSRRRILERAAHP